MLTIENFINSLPLDTPLEGFFEQNSQFDRSMFAKLEKKHHSLLYAVVKTVSSELLQSDPFGTPALFTKLRNAALYWHSKAESEKDRAVCAKIQSLCHRFLGLIPLLQGAGGAQTHYRLILSRGENQETIELLQQDFDSLCLESAHLKGSSASLSNTCISDGAILEIQSVNIPGKVLPANPPSSLAEFTFCFGEERIQVPHSTFLSLCLESPLIKAACTSFKEKQERKISLPTISLPVFKTLLKHIPRDQIVLTEQDGNLLELIAAAEYLQLESLQYKYLSVLEEHALSLSPEEFELIWLYYLDHFVCMKPATTKKLGEVCLHYYLNRISLFFHHNPFIVKEYCQKYKPVLTKLLFASKEENALLPPLHSQLLIFYALCNTPLAGFSKAVSYLDQALGVIEKDQIPGLLMGKLYLLRAFFADYIEEKSPEDYLGIFFSGLEGTVEPKMQNSRSELKRDYINRAERQLLFLIMSRQPQHSSILAYYGYSLYLLDKKACAQSTFRQALTIDPTNTLARTWLGETLRASGKSDRAMKAYNQVLSTEPHNVLVLSGMAEILREKKQWDAALNNLEIALAIEPKNHFCLICRGKILFAQGKYNEALIDLNEGLAVDQANAAGLASRAEIYLLNGEYSRALEEINLSLNITKTVNAFVCRARIYLQQSKIASAFHDLRDALDLEPDHPEALRQISIVFMLNDDLDRALIELNHSLGLALEDSLGHAAALYCRAKIYHKKNENSAALQDLDKVLMRHPNHAPALETRAAILTKLDEHQLALKDWNEVLRLNPLQKDILYQRAFVLERQEKYKEALEDLDKALSMDSAHVPSLIQRGRVLAKIGSYDLAMHDFELAESIDPSNSTLLVEKGKCLELAGNYYHALYEFHKILKLDPDNVFALTERGRIYLLTRDDANAMSNLTLALKHEPQCSEALFLRSQLHLLHENREDARKDIKALYKGKDTSIYRAISTGELCYLENNFCEALNEANKALENNSHAVDALLLRCKCYLKTKALRNKAKGDFDAVKSLLRKQYGFGIPKLYEEMLNSLNIQINFLVGKVS